MDEFIVPVLMGAFVVIGYLLGNGQSSRMLNSLREQHKIHRNTMDNHYKEVVTLLNQYSNLSTQLFNQSKNTIGPSAEFLPGEAFTESETAEAVSEPEPDLSGGRI